MQSNDQVEKLREALGLKKEAEEATANPQPASPDQNELAAELESWKQKYQEEHDQFLRTYAEFENYRKRMTREKEESLRYSAEKILHELLPVLDGLEKTLEHSQQSSDVQQLNQGVELVLKQSLKALEKFGLKPLEASGQPFDPNYHEAMGYEEVPGHEPNTVVQEYRRGYLLHDRLLRPALVTVAKSSED